MPGINAKQYEIGEGIRKLVKTSSELGITRHGRMKRNFSPMKSNFIFRTDSFQ